MADEKRNESEYLELLYNLHHVCESLIYDGPDVAEDLLRQRIRQITAANGGNFPVLDGLIMVTSLNRCIYDFFQFYFHISFTGCCSRNRVNDCEAKTWEDVFAAGSKVLRDYHRAYTESRGLSGHMEKARCYIRSHLADELSLKSVGDAIHISGGYLSRIFSTLTGQTFCDYVRDERMAAARQLLAGTDLSIDAIAEKCGFGSSGYFATVFKGYMGKTPSEYRSRKG
jgi:AraC-type DNA-binding domain-containing proteins